jgi:hypothetical protein
LNVGLVASFDKMCRYEKKCWRKQRRLIVGKIM